MVTHAVMDGSIHLPLHRRTVLPAYHLRQAIRAAHVSNLVSPFVPVVPIVFVGESNLMRLPTTSFSELDSAAGQIASAFQTANPFCSFPVHNIAYGGATFTSLNLPTLQDMIDDGFVLGSWATGNEALSLYEMAATYSPAIICILCGTNDRNNFVPAQRRAVEQGFAAACPNASVIWLTGPQWSRNTASSASNTAATQRGTTAVAHFIASTCAMTRKPFIDFHHFHMALVQGRDVHRTRIIDGTPAAQAITTPATLTGETDLDCDVSMTWTGTWTNRKLRMSTGYAGTNGSTAIEIVPSGGVLNVVIGEISLGTFVATNTIVSSLATPADGAQTVLISLRDEQALVSVNGTVIFRGIAARMGGTWTPVISFVATAGSPSLAQAMSVIYRRCVYADVFAVMSDADALGGPTVANTIEGGNDINHWSSEGVMEIVAGALSHLDLRLPLVSEGTTEFPGTDNRYAGIGTASPQGILHIVKEAVADYVASATANGLIVMGTPIAGMSLATSNDGAVQIIGGSPSDPDAMRITYTVSTGVMSFWAGGVELMRLVVPGSDNVAAMQIATRISGAVAMKSVSVGANDSGGTGRRTTLIAN